MINPPNDGPREVCFMVMPYGRRATELVAEGVPEFVDFDRLWERAYEPALRTLGYEPVRADMDLGALIIKEMIERLVIARVVCAEISIPNANVYYELGVRHAAQEHGCVMLAAEWAQPLFDLSQMPRLSYPMDDGEVGEECAQQIRNVLLEHFPRMAGGTSPVFQSVDGYPEAQASSAAAFKAYVDKLSKFQGRVLAARRAAPSTRQGKVMALVAEVSSSPGELPAAVSLELLYLLRDTVSWQTTRDYIEQLPEQLQALSVVREQLALAQSKSGDHDEAIAGLEALMALSGETSERRGLLGGRYKQLMREAESAEDRSYCLTQAIDNYQRGSNLDLNDYYPTCNLPLLYRTRGAAGDEKLAQSAAAITLAAVHRAKARHPKDEWIRPTLLVAAFHDGNVETSKALCAEIRREGADKWKLATTLPDLAQAIELLADESVQADLLGVHDELQGLAGQT